MQMKMQRSQIKSKKNQILIRVKIGGLQLDTTNKGSRPEIQAETRGREERFNCRIFERRVDRRDTTNKRLWLQPFEMPPEEQQIERKKKAKVLKVRQKTQPRDS